MNQVWFDCKSFLEIKDYNIINTRNYNSRSRKSSMDLIE
jgi:hypothetical protein